MTIKIDTGADVIVVSEKLYKRHLGGIALTNARKKLRVGDSIPLRVLGVAQVKIKWQKEAIIDHVYMVKESMQPLLGRPAIKALGMLDWKGDICCSPSSYTLAVLLDGPGFSRMRNCDAASTAA